jgi:hypothetical protein
VVPERDPFTKHGLHLNIKGKEAIVKRLVAEIPGIVGKHKVSDPICLVWKDDMTNQFVFA